MTHKKHTLLLGGHMSIAGGLEKSLLQGSSIGCSAIQLFTKSNRQWAAKKISSSEGELFKQTALDVNIHAIVVHASYLINLGSPHAITAEKSIQAVITELERCHQLGIKYLVVHPGSHTGTTQEAGLENIIIRLNKIFEHTSELSCHLLLENMAGQGSSICSTFEQLATVINAIDHKKRIGVCFDTCHAFAAGYDFQTSSSYSDLWKKFDQTIGLDYLKAFHLNNSKTACGSHVDRHAELDQGHIQQEAFKLLMNDKNFFDIPKILETPLGFDGYAHNMQLLKKMISANNKKLLGVDD
jgi:deoxyribonuclease-4